MLSLKFSYRLFFIGIIVIFWMVAHKFIVGDKQRSDLFKIHLNLCLFLSSGLIILSYLTSLTYMTEPNIGWSIVLTIYAPVYVPILWSLSLVAYSFFLKTPVSSKK